MNQSFNERTSSPIQAINQASLSADALSSDPKHFAISNLTSTSVVIVMCIWINSECMNVMKDRRNESKTEASSLAARVELMITI